MTADRRRHPSRNLQRRIRRRQAKTGESYLTAAAAVEAEWEQGQRYLSDPAVPADMAAAVHVAGLIPLEPVTVSPGWDWWCRCRWCDAVVDVAASGGEPPAPGRLRHFGESFRHAAGLCSQPEPDLYSLELEEDRVRWSAWVDAYDCAVTEAMQGVLAGRGGRG
ncbi:hypothetical protein [Actinomadura sp. 9N215]|uniref:hypothetical protein n=1 Tax=Actinomadura sp. 9N215 TaxID=3375150 RepID=UPI0037B4E107